MKTDFKRDFNFLVLVREMIFSTCSPVSVFYCVSVDNTKNLRGGVSALTEISPTGRWTFLPFIDYMSSSWCITVV